MKNFRRWVLVVMVAQQCKRTWCHWTVHLKMVKMVNFICVFYHNLKHTFICKNPGIQSKFSWGLCEEEGLIVFSHLPHSELLWVLRINLGRREREVIHSHSLRAASLPSVLSRAFLFPREPAGEPMPPLWPLLIPRHQPRWRTPGVLRCLFFIWRGP